MTAPPAAPARVYLHVGVPKTGTTFVQDVLWRSRSQLAEHGVCYPLEKRTEHFAATMDVRRAAWGGRRNPAWSGTWDRLAETISRSGAHTGVLSSELLAAADREAVARALASFPEHEVHVVVTARDLGRQLTSGWQEQVKHRVSLTLEEFVAVCLGEPDAGHLRMANRFWKLHDLGDVVSRWGSGLPADRLHLVTVPPPGAPRELLWQRFAEVTGVDAALGRMQQAHPNLSLTSAEAEFLRRYNRQHSQDVDQPDYDQVVRVLVAERSLAAGQHRPPGQQPTLPPRFADAVTARAQGMVEALTARGHPVVGDLADLVPDPETLRAAEPTTVDDREVATAGVRAVAGLISELGPLQRRLGARVQTPQAAFRAPTAGWDRRLDAVPRRAGSSQPPPDAPVYLHVGAPKTGTTFLQDTMWQHRSRLADAGVLFARRRYADHFEASLDLRGARKQGVASRATWDGVVADVAAWPGTSVVSHELFAPARQRHIARAMTSLGPERVHLVYSVRDLWGLLGAEWQESTKHGRGMTFADFLTDVLDEGPGGVVGGWFWSVHDAVDVLRRWGHDLPPERVHVLTVPTGGGRPNLLWERFAGLVGIQPDSIDTTSARSNTSLGAQEVAFLREVNSALAGPESLRVPRGDQRRLVKDVLAQDILAGRPGKTRYAPPLELFERVSARAEELVDGLRVAGYDVVGDLAELVPQRPRSAPVQPDETSGAELVDVALDALAGLVARTAELRGSHQGSAKDALPRLAGRLRESGTALGRRLARTVRERRP
ncbi:MAG: hypothetical protein AVDCRST_MAG29-1639 [uncultured Nocardioidaceae bacterium]|uniref:Sulfotransferase domain-containing protein n=1 Tax=uncultured Nocardioidaceae bacterium TaxID=253824 RepID=A0A6J4LU88_9ACTN|nr:MAG: hypothetical protein AVDCRST_MAG29-1639 [uncultured Nocardioidaceae bacterium]